MKPAPLMYFLPGNQTPPAAVPPYVLDGTAPLARKEPADGIGGAMGALATPCAGLLSLDFAPGTQDWHKLPGGADPAHPAYLVLTRGDKPTPAELQRQTLIAGHGVTLGDGQVWQIPVARLVTGGTALPRRRAYDVAGRKVWQVEVAYRQLCEDAEKVWSFHNGGGVIFADDDLDRICSAALSVNYRLGEFEAITLGLFTAEAQRGILQALVDLPTVHAILDAEKKTPAIPAV